MDLVERSELEELQSKQVTELKIFNSGLKIGGTKFKKQDMPHLAH
ncbi:MAG: hypothetical protein Ct9H300mP4_11210 [Gammaproteobacteria bacterium]|nr:MAG: hypothetical protein Ct9H300mP4_11210 [Gammaproteobacteria bacterium]